MITLSSQEKEVLEAIDVDHLIEMTRTLIRIQSVNPPGNYSEISSFIHNKLVDLGLEVELFEGIKGKTNVFGLLRGLKPARSLLLSGHMDVVGAEDGNWEQDPFGGQLIEGFVWGRGAVDMKAAIAAQIAAVQAIASKYKTCGSLMIGATVDDEIAGPMGMKYVINEGIPKIGWPRPDFHVLGEANNLNVTTAFKGRIWLRISVTGKSAHGGSPELGISAIERLIAVIREIEALPRTEHPLMGRDTVNVGTICGGERVNVVPGFCDSNIDYRFCYPLSSDEAKHRVFQAIDRAAKHFEPCVEIKYEAFECREPIEQDIDSEPIRLAADCVRTVAKRDCQFLGVLSAGDAYYTILKGISGCWIGPGDPKLLHAVNERISVEEILLAAKIYALIAMRFCGLE